MEFYSLCLDVPIRDSISSSFTDIFANMCKWVKQSWILIFKYFSHQNIICILFSFMCRGCEPVGHFMGPQWGFTVSWRGSEACRLSIHYLSWCPLASEGWHLLSDDREGPEAWGLSSTHKSSLLWEVKQVHEKSNKGLCAILASLLPREENRAICSVSDSHTLHQAPTPLPQLCDLK